ncbi:hypothetical protein D3C71_1703430 [compost metagenome]
MHAAARHHARPALVILLGAQRVGHRLGLVGRRHLQRFGQHARAYRMLQGLMRHEGAEALAVALGVFGRLVVVGGRDRQHGLGIRA